MVEATSLLHATTHAALLALLPRLPLLIFARLLRER
jgi:hypothetical protein